MSAFMNFLRRVKDDVERHNACRRALAELREKIAAYKRADDIQYDGDEDDRAQELSRTGIDLDDFIMTHADELIDGLDRAVTRYNWTMP